MDGPLGGRRAGKIGVAILWQHGDAVEADLALHGLTLASLSLRLAATLAEHLARTHGTCTWRACGGDEWTLTDHLLALIHDQLALANWQRSKDGAKGRNRPKPISPLRNQARRERRIGGTGRSPDEVRALLAQIGPRG